MRRQDQLDIGSAHHTSGVEPMPVISGISDARGESKLAPRLRMSLSEAERLSARLLAERGARSALLLHELIWLRTVFIEQQQRTPVAERRRFERRADRILEQLGSSGLSDGPVTVRRNDKR